MKVSQQNTDNVNAVISIEITKADYTDKVDKALKTYRQKAAIPGFRKGMVPKSVIQKMFGKTILLEEINKLVSDSLLGYIRENKLNILGEPLPADDQPEIDFDNQEDFKFVFDIALAPEINVGLSKKDKIDYYNIKVDDEMVRKQIESFAGRYGSQVPVETASENDMLKGTLTELDTDEKEKEGGLVVENAVLSPAYLKDETEKAKFAGVKAGDTVVFNPAVAAGGNEAELVSLLHLQKGDSIPGSDFRFVVAEVLGYQPAAVDQELFDKVFGKDSVKSEEEFRAKVAEMLKDQLKPESDYKFELDARAALEQKAGDIEFPEAFLKRWLVVSGENRTPESIEEEFPKMMPELKWHLIKEQIARNFEIKVDDNDLLDAAKKATRAQFAQYGMANIPADLLENYAREMLKKKENVRGLADRATEEKIMNTIKDSVTLNEKEISSEDFYKMFENK